MDEFALITRYFKNRFQPNVNASTGVELGIGDDCAILNLPNRKLVVSTDTQVEGRHFPNKCSGGVTAARALGAAASDLAAMGASPEGFTLALSIPNYEAAWLEDFSTMLASLSDQWRLPLIGGDTVAGPLAVTVTVFGSLPMAEEGLRRDRALPEEDIWVSGYLGQAVAGLRITLDGDSAPAKGNLANSDVEFNESGLARLLKAYQSPAPQLVLGINLREAKLANSAIDISDGLLADLGHICQASKVGAEIWIESLPISKELLQFMGQEEARKAALSGGDDYQLCFIAPKSKREELLQLSQGAAPLTRIGVTTTTGVMQMLLNNQEYILSRKGFNHFDS